MQEKFSTLRTLLASCTPSPSPCSFAPFLRLFMLFIRFVFAFRLGSGSLRPCPVSLVKGEALPLVSVLRGSDRLGSERKNRKARVLPCGSALALWYHVGTLPPGSLERIGKPASSFYGSAFSAFIYFSCSSCRSCTKGAKSVLWFFFRSHGASLPGCQDPPALLKS